MPNRTELSVVSPLSQPQLETEKCSLNHRVVYCLVAHLASVVPTGWGGGAGSFGVTFLIMSPGAWINQCCSSAVERLTAKTESYLGMPVMGAWVPSHAGMIT